MLIMAMLFTSLLFISSAVVAQESLQILTLHQHGSAPEVSHTMGVSVEQEKLNEVSSSVLMAEKWLRTHVLSYYPSTNITSIVVASKPFCNNKSFKYKEEMSRLILLSMKNIHHSLTRWGLERNIKVSVSLSSNCVQEPHLKPVFSFLEEINSTYTVDPPHISDEIVKMLTSQLNSMKDSVGFQPKTVNLISPVSKQAKPTSRKLSFIDPLPESGYSVPSDAALPPLIGVSAPFSPPLMGPVSSPSPHNGFNLPPCNPYHGGGARAAPPAVARPPMMGGGEEGLWCVAKPSVPSEKLQEAMDYACGAGGADCEAISPNGSCYFPDSVVAHASYAFNSYWQKNKNNGGTCGFGGTAMLITSDPSYVHCQFTLS